MSSGGRAEQDRQPAADSGMPAVLGPPGAISSLVPQAQATTERDDTDLTRARRTTKVEEDGKTLAGPSPAGRPFPNDGLSTVPYASPAAATAEPAVSVAETTTATESSAPDAARPYSAFSPATKWSAAVLTGITAVFSPISSNIFVPAIPTLARDFGRSTEDISLAVTIYLVFQAVTPSFFGAASDSFGRRPVILLTMIVYIASNIGLALMPTSAFWLLLVLRALQSTGGSAMIAIGYGVVNDIAAPREKGKYMAVFIGSAMSGPALGPLLGGIFADTLGWRAMFWFLMISSAVMTLLVLFFLPETLRSIVGDGSIPPPMLNASPVAIWQRRSLEKQRKAQGLELAREHVERPPPKKFKPLSAFMILFTPEILIIFIVVSVPYLFFYCLLTVFSTALEDAYHLNQLQIGLCYLPSGGGTILTAFFNGRQLDYYYRREEARVGGDFRAQPERFRVELTRLRCLYPFIFTLVAAGISLGWALHARAHLAATLVLQFLVGLGTGTIGTATVYGQDLLPSQGGAVSASCNLVRCAFGAVGTSVIMLMYNRIGSGWSFVILGGACLAVLPLSVLVIFRGKVWRKRRAERAARRAERAKEGVDQHDEEKRARGTTTGQGQEHGSMEVERADEKV